MRLWLTRHSKAVAAFVLAMVCALLGAWFLSPSSPPGAALGRASYDSYYAWFGLADGVPESAPVVIVYLDLESYRRFGQDPAKPWPRELHAILLDRLKAAGAQAVVFDIVFDSPGSDPSADRALAEAIRGQGKVVLAGEMSVSSQSSGSGLWARATRVDLPWETFRQAAAAWGLGEVAVDDDFVARRHFAGVFADTEARYSLSWSAARLLELPAVTRVDRREQARWFRYYGPPFTLPHVGYSRVLDGEAGDDAMFRDKVVFVGARPMAGSWTERRDELRSPFHQWREPDLFMPGVEVHATQMLNLMGGDWLHRLSPGMEGLVILLAGVGLGLGLIWLRPVPATVVGGAVASLTAVAAVLLFRQVNLWFPWLIVAGAQVPVALGGSVLVHSIEWYRARRGLEAAKRVADARIREQAALIDKARDAILVRNRDGGISYANPSAERLYGWSLPEWQAGAAAALFDVPATVAACRAAEDGGEWNGELHQVTRTGRELIVESRWTLLRGEDARPSGMLIINTDITEKKQLEAESLRMQRMEAVGALAGGMAHDLNNALAPVLMGTQLLRRGIEDENSRRILALMESSTRRGADMVRQVLLFARGRQGDRERLDVGPLVKEMEKLARDTFPPDIKVSSHVATDLWPVLGQATPLHQVLLNLCVNARDAMPEGGSLTLAADNVLLGEDEARAIPEGRPGEFVVLMVSDTGSGMTAEVLERIFEPFFTTKAEGQGTGLGLSTTARIVKAHEGFLAVQSQVGEGTTFEIYLPRFRESTTVDIGRTAPVIARGQGELILLADDDEAVREVLLRGLEEHGYRVTTVANGAEAVSYFKRNPDAVALFITDQSMPVLDGRRAAALLAEIKPGLPVLFLSGEEAIRPSLEGNDPESFRCLPKPIELDSLLAAVAQALGGTPR